MDLAQCYLWEMATDEKKDDHTSSALLNPFHKNGA
jgi:hypothetical protein